MKSLLNIMFKFTEFGKKSGSIHKKNIQKAFHQNYLTLNLVKNRVLSTKRTFKKFFIKNILPQNIILGMFSKKNPDSTNRSPKTGKNNFI